MLIAITGGTGFVGRAVQRHLLKAGHTVRLITRRNPSPRQESQGPSGDLAGSRVEFRAPSPESPEAAADALRGADALLHLVGIISEHGAQRFEAVHPGLTQYWLKAAERAGISRILHMSALGTRPEARSRYHQTKWAAETRVRESRLAWTIFRPSIIYGAEDAFTQLFARMARWAPVLPLLGGGHNLLQPISVEQVAAAFTKALDTPAAEGQTWDLCGPERLALATMVRQILDVTGRRRWLCPIPWGIARLQATVLEFVFTRLGQRPSPLTRDQLLMLQEDNVGDGLPADRALGLSHLRFREGLERYLAPAVPGAEGQHRGPGRVR